MKLTLFIAIIVFLRYLVPKLVDFGAPEKSQRKSEWELRVKFAKLNKELFEKSDPERKEELIYYYTHKIRQTDHYGVSSFANMPKLLRVVYLINNFESEINNGGYLQFFTNQSGRYTEETLEALEAIGAEYNHSLLLNAVQILRQHDETTDNLNTSTNGVDLNTFITQFHFYGDEKLSIEMQQLNEAFYEYKEDISKLKMDYFERNNDSLWGELEEKYGNISSLP